MSQKVLNISSNPTYKYSVYQEFEKPYVGLIQLS